QCRGSRVERLLVAGLEPREQQMAGAKMPDIAAGGLGGGGDLFQPGAIDLRCHDIRDPTIGETSGAGKGRVGAATDPNRRPTGLARRRLHRYLAEGAEIAAAIADRLAAPQLAQQRDRCREAPASLAQVYAASLEFLWEFAADADAKNQPTFAQMIERCGLLRNRHGVAQRHEIDIGAELEPPADHGRLRQLQ